VAIKHLLIAWSSHSLTANSPANADACLEPVVSVSSWLLLLLPCVQSPEVWDLLDRIKQVVKPYGVQLLCEVHEDFVSACRWHTHVCKCHSILLHPSHSSVSSSLFCIAAGS
jgi:hypothetical protein